MTPPAPLARVGAAALEGVLRSPLMRGKGDAYGGLPLALARMLRRLDRHTDTRIDPSRAGRALLTAAPAALGDLAACLPKGCALVSGTNGKTTTTNLLADIVRASGSVPVVNHVGTNMPGGLLAELVARSRRGGGIDAETGVFEVDELWLDHIVPPIRPRVILLGNLFRDQLDRMGELDRVAGRWRAFVERLDRATVLVVNADDPRVCQLASSHPNIVHFGLADCDRDRPPPGSDLPECRHCGGTLAYAGSHIGHLGRWECTSCGDRRPAEVSVEAGSLQLRGLRGSSFLLAVRPPWGEGGTARSDRVELGVPGRFNVANAAAAAAAALALGCPAESVRSGLSRSAGAFGRSERLSIDGREVTVILAKNPCGFDEVITMLADHEEPLELLLLLNDGGLDGRDVSWVWDADVERLAPLVGLATCGGRRASDAALRLDHAGVEPSRIEVVEGIAESLRRALERGAGPVVVVSNYSAMIELRELVAEQGHAARYWR